jgi:hypothetical protein
MWTWQVLQELSSGIVNHRRRNESKQEGSKRSVRYAHKMAARLESDPHPHQVAGMKQSEMPV